MKLILINSFGPMGSSVIASFLEKFNYVNLPIRKRDFNKYLLGERNLNDPYFKNETLRILQNLEKKSIRGGISVLDRDKSQEIPRFDLSIVRKDLEQFNNKNFNRFSDIYFESMLIANKCVTYKNRISKPKGIIELSVNIQKFNKDNLYKAYKKNFENLKVINLTREFDSLINSLSSQNYSQNIMNINRYKLNLYNYKLAYKKYLKSIETFQGININFDDIFEPYTENTLNRISDYIGEEKKDIKQLKYETFDLYGKITGYKKTFSKFDDKQNFIPKFGKSLANFFFHTKNNLILNIFVIFIFQLSYLFGLIKFILKFK